MVMVLVDTEMDTVTAMVMDTAMEASMEVVITSKSEQVFVRRLKNCSGDKMVKKYCATSVNYVTEE